MCEILHKSVRSLLLGCSLWAVAACGTAPSSPHRAALAVVGSDGSVQTTCVEFDQAQMSGLDLLDRSGLDYIVDASNPMGALVCQIGSEGCGFPAQSCLCQCTLGQPCRYWAYFNRSPDSDWVYAVSGPSSRKIEEGEVDAWVWLLGDETSQAVPSSLEGLTFDTICGAGAP
jgi:hypothetical protein